MSLFMYVLLDILCRGDTLRSFQYDLLEYSSTAGGISRQFFNHRLPLENTECPFKIFFNCTVDDNIFMI